MKTITINVFTYDELSEDAKERAYNSWLSGSRDYFWGEENRKTLEKFAEEINVNIDHWEYGGRGEGVRWSSDWDYEDEKMELSGLRLLRYIQNNWSGFLYYGRYYSKTRATSEPGKYAYVSRKSKVLFSREPDLTGYCIDYSICSPIYDFIKKPDNTTLKELINNCFYSWIEACNEDLEYTQSQEYFADEAEANNYEFDEDGRQL